MNIEQVNNNSDAVKCNDFLEKLIQSEKQYNENIKPEFKVENWFENFYNEKNNAIFVAKEDEKIIGYIYIQITSADDGPTIDKEALVDGLYVDEQYRGKGVAKALISKVEEWAKRNDVQYVYINVLEENTTALNLYKKLDFNNFELKLKKKI